MEFDKILTNTSESTKDSFAIQALKKQQYNRQYQAKLRQRAKLLTLEKKVDENLAYVIGYVKKNYQYELDHYKEPVVVPAAPVKPQLGTWLLLSAAEYSSPDEAYDLFSGKDEVAKAEFQTFFAEHYTKNDKGSYSKL